MVVGCQAPAPPSKFLEQAQRIHEEAFASLIASDSDLNDYLQLIGDRLADAAYAAAPSRVNQGFIHGVRCRLIDSKTINCFSLGGMNVYVTSGLFKQCQSEEELATAMAHAYAHLANLDLEATAMQPDDRSPLSLVVWQYAVNRFTLEQERKADALALEIYTRGGWDPAQFPKLFEQLEGQSGGNVAPDREPLPVRAGELQNAVSSLAPSPHKLPVADPKTFASLRERAASYREISGAPVTQIYLRSIPNCLLSSEAPEQHEAQERLRPQAPPPVQRLEPN